jgi:hypothetical protein
MHISDISDAYFKVHNYPKPSHKLPVFIVPTIVFLLLLFQTHSVC